MSSRTRRIAGWIWLLSGVAGCASWTEPAKPNKHPAGLNMAQHREKHSDSVASYEQKRNEAQYQAALSRWRQGDAENAENLLRKLLERQPAHLASRLLMSEIQLTEGTPQASLEHAQAAVTIAPLDAAAQHQLATTLDALGRSAEALPHYRKACELDPSNAMYRVDLQAVEDPNFQPPEATAAMTPPAAPRAKPDLASATQPTTPTIRVTTRERQLPGTLAEHAADMKAARLQGGRKSNERVQLAAAQQPAAEEGAAAALVQLQAEMQAAPGDVQVPLTAAVAALRQGQPVLAAQLAQTGLREFADCAALYRALGTAFYQLGEYGRAETALRKAISLDNRNASTYFLLGCALDKLGQGEAARPLFEQARQLDPKYADATSRR